MRPIDTDERTTLSALDVEECLVLLRWENIGRLAVSIADDAPLVVPVNFAVFEDTVVFRSTEGTKLDRLRENPMSLQVDRFDQYRRVGWSVLVRGNAHEMTPDEAPDIDFDSWI